MLELFFNNLREELIQKTAWRLVRAAEDKYGAMKGSEKREWCIERMKRLYPKLGDAAEEHIRAAFVNFSIEFQFQERKPIL